MAPIRAVAVTTTASRARTARRRWAASCEVQLLVGSTPRLLPCGPLVSPCCLHLCRPGRPGRQCLNTFTGYSCTCGHGFISHMEADGTEVGRHCRQEWGWDGVWEFPVIGRMEERCLQTPLIAFCRPAWTSTSVCPSASLMPTAHASAALARTHMAATSEWEAGPAPPRTTNSLHCSLLTLPRAQPTTYQACTTGAELLEDV